MKKLITLSILFISLTFVAPIQASAATSAGLKPGNFFYIFDTVSEKIGLFFTFNPENKAKKALGYADERLAEIEAISGENNPDAVKTAISNYESNVALATEKSKEVKDKGQEENLLNLITDNASKNQEVLSAVLIKVPEEAREAIVRAIEASKKGQEEATKQITELKGEIEQLKKEVVESRQVSGEEQSTEIELLRKEVEILKSQQSLQSVKSQTVEKVPEKIVEISPIIEAQPIISAPLPDYKVQAFTILNNAKDNYVRLVNFSRECTSMAIKRKAIIQNSASDRVSFLPKVAFDSYLNDIFTLLYNSYDNEIGGMEGFRVICEVTYLNIFNNNIYKIDAAMLALQQSNNPVSFEQLINYQLSYLDTKKIEDDRANVQNIIDRINNMIMTHNTQLYTPLLNTAKKYVDQVTTPTAQPAIQYVSPAPILPQAPKITRCTIGTIGGGGVDLMMNCYESSF
ncbi:MAG: DUF5667 domain-containing protein [bacterium]|nr:DUF5667 domain-containing protein [bacterium]